MTHLAYLLVGILGTTVARDRWHRIQSTGRWARWRWHQLLSWGAEPNQTGGLPLAAERHLWAEVMRHPTEEFHSLIGSTWAPSTEDVWSTP